MSDITFGSQPPPEATMSQILESICPLCQSPAKYEQLYARHLKHFLCPICKEIIIKFKAERWLKDASEQARLYHSAASAKVESGFVYFISRSPDEDLPENPSVRGRSMKYEDAIKL